MTNLTNGELYTMLLHRLRKDRKGSISPEEFESFLKWRNLDYFNKALRKEGATQLVDASLAPFVVLQDVQVIYSSLYEYYIILYNSNSSNPPTDPPLKFTSYDVAKIINIWWTDSLTNFSSKIRVDLLTYSEWSDRINNAITGPSNDYPIAYLGGEFSVAGVPNAYYFDTLWLKGGTGFASGYIILDYYKYPAEPYFDYYTDSSGNITYLTDGQAAYTLLTDEQSRDGKIAGQAVTSTSQDLEWDDEDALVILDMIVSDVSIALSDPNSFQASLLERKDNA